MQRDMMEYDVVIVGAGPAGLASAIRLKQLANRDNRDISVCVLEKGSEVGAHIISGCVMDPRGLNELLPGWQEMDFPVTTIVGEEKLLYLTAKSRINLPIPKQWSSHGCYMISLSQLCRKLAVVAESLGVEIYPGFSAAGPIIENGVLKGIITGDMGVNADGTPGSNYQMGMEIRATQTILAEGCRGSLSKQLIAEFNLDVSAQPQTYGLGIKEVWRVTDEFYRPGKIIHALGYPLDNETYGGGFLYHLNDNLVSVGLVTALDYKNPYLSPYDEFQRFKLHPEIRKVLENGERIEYGARSVVEGGIQALPQLAFPGGVLCGDSAGFINVPRIKGVHNALKSGMLAADAINLALANNARLASDYSRALRRSWLYDELYAVRNIRPAFQYGRLAGILYTGIEQFILRGKVPWTLKIKRADHECLEHKSRFSPKNYLPYDGKITFDKASSVHLANLSHEENQPCHLRLKDQNVPIQTNWVEYASPETRFCPAGVYEIIHQQGKSVFQINAQNCIHCKACDIKDIKQNIQWTVPEGGSGPQYSEM